MTHLVWMMGKSLTTHDNRASLQQWADARASQVAAAGGMQGRPTPPIEGMPGGGRGGKSAARLVLLHPPALAFFYHNFSHCP